MKRNRAGVNPVVAVFVVVIAGAILFDTLRSGLDYRNASREVRSNDQLTSLLDRLYYDQQVASALRLLQKGDTAAAARKLDLALCCDIIRVNTALGESDAHGRECVTHCFSQIAQSRPAPLEADAGGSALQLDQQAAGRILAAAAHADAGRVEVTDLK